MYKEVVAYDYNNHTAIIQADIFDSKNYIPECSYVNILLTLFAIILWERLSLIISMYGNIRKDFENITINLCDAKMKTLKEIIDLDERSSKKISLIKREIQS